MNADSNPQSVNLKADALPISHYFDDNFFVGHQFFFGTAQLSLSLYRALASIFK